ncbi:tRNA (guanosine(46)-N7)-methyltransferase TrmB [Lentilactobacillus senioris]|uniref:tRNA (guanine-N(7)-)-methyltransferase n=1 Tax=Lentilactobacillus senioris DSM 24302 = JCM 17472 TaxID=1423802 RepID=A0A0R2CQL9_9LACO|nr:tRNA (guanosine(46)-N7)-methyltransferase TrmB [Lentilactobacillus senioris]KRM93960.1 S-adenosylmethionine-dependent methyltransferase [Lentilactobacillus senioris DSM 24302 = JCM 17472]
MRVRKKPWADDFINDHQEFIVLEPQQLQGKWQERFAKDQPLAVEIGTGKGQFITEMAKKYPNINFIGIELQTSVIAVALRKLVENPLPNVQLVLTDGADVNEIFATGEVDRIYLNFSDPWPKKRHAKRRLTSPQFLKGYQMVLNPTGDVEFKTDNRGLFEYSLGSFNNYGLVFDDVYLDLHRSEANEDNVETEYEQKFSAKGPIYKLVAHFKTEN